MGLLGDLGFGGLSQMFQSHGATARVKLSVHGQSSHVERQGAEGLLLCCGIRRRFERSEVTCNARGC